MANIAATTKRAGDAAPEDLALLDQWIEEVYDLNKLSRRKGSIPRPTSTATAKQILKRDGAGAIAMVRAYIVKLQQHHQERVSHEFMHLLADRLLKRELPFSEADLIWLAGQVSETGDFWEWPLKGIVAALERHVAAHGMSDALRSSTQKMIENIGRTAWHKPERDLLPRLRKLTGGSEFGFSVDPAEPWAWQVQADVSRMPGELREKWTRLLAHAQNSTSSAPQQPWLSEARGLTELVGRDEFCDRLTKWFPLFAKGRTDEPPEDKPYMREGWDTITSVVNELLLKGLIWHCQAIADPRLRPTLEALRDECYRQTRHGKRFASGGTACLRAIQAMGL